MIANYRGDDPDVSCVNRLSERMCKTTLEPEPSFAASSFSCLHVQMPRPEEVTHSQNHLCAVEGLGQEVIRTEDQRGIACDIACVSGEHDDGETNEI